MRPTWWAILLLTAALSGCATNVEVPAATDPAPETGDDEPTPQSEPDAEPEPEPEPEPNTPPMANLTSDVVNGTSPLNVTFTIDGDDADGDELTWALDADGDGVVDAEGDVLPATFSFVFESGTFHSMLTVSDGTESGSATLDITADAPTRPPINETWALVWPSDGGTGCTEAYMSLTEASDIVCGNLGQSVAAVADAADETIWYTFPADAGTRGFPANTSVQTDIRVFVVQPFVGTLHAELLVDGSVVGSGNVEIVPEGVAVSNPTHRVSFTAETEVAAEAVLTFRYAYATVGYMENISGTVQIG